MKKADASPTKDFFVRMITRDISLEDCILDLVDNCLDGARRNSNENEQSGEAVSSYNGYYCKIDISPSHFTISDNCGGISVSHAIDYAFHFGRRPDAPSEGEYSIGLYGIGMKRAILKIGKEITISSSTKNEAFLCKIDVDDWLSYDEWEFELFDEAPRDPPGTFIKIEQLYDGISGEFADSTFSNGLSRIIARDYSRFLEKGFKIFLNETEVKRYQFAVRASDEFVPYRKSYDDNGVYVEIIAGMAASPPDDLEPSERTDIGYYGWFVLCNDRVVIAADKTDLTIWGDEGFQRWHPQYNGFMGMAIFSSNDPNLLPWTTTKRDIEESSPLYRRAIKEMKTATLPWLAYTNQRKDDLEIAREKENSASNVSMFSVPSICVIGPRQP